jgi:hypothetical protein
MTGALGTSYGVVTSMPIRSWPDAEIIDDAMS